MMNIMASENIYMRVENIILANLKMVKKTVMEYYMIKMIE